ncbi:lipoprotein [Ureaplasma parvum serovar 14 str. ATCC 33697]|uniref:Ig-specific serine endopeptidase MIP n=1 Tax=Ureaplasma parvum TaxID=134821 RepID=UPI0001725138|nr:lipoprotein 17-related variable surface protein [Ureaplasma parvum]EDT87863.1 lipoprotein [Ureaplasma parvum serovar 14 str. ATCC 33697]
MKKNKLTTLALILPITILTPIVIVSCTNKTKVKKSSSLDKIASNLKLEYFNNKANTKASSVQKDEIKKPLNLPNDVVFSVKDVCVSHKDQSVLIVKYTLKKGNEIQEYTYEIKGFKFVHEKDKIVNDLSQANEDFKKIVNNIRLKDTFDFKLAAFPNQNYDQLLPSQIYKNYYQGIEIQQHKYQNELDIKIINFLYPNGDFGSANKSGTLKLSLMLTDKKNNQVYYKLLEVSGFKSNPYGVDENGTIPGIGTERLKPKNQDDYFSKTQLQRYEIDNKGYLQILKRQNNDKNWKELRPDLNATISDIKYFDEKAKSVGQDSYESAAYKGFTLPVYESDGKINGLALAGKDTPKGPSWVDAIGRNQWQIGGLPRTLPNEKYRQEAMQTFSLGILNNDPHKNNTYNKTAGTTWILDYQKTSDNKYPTKWYFATNLHVADAINENTSSINLMRLMDSAQIKTTFRLSNLDENIYSFGFRSKEHGKNLLNHGLKKIFDGRDFLKTKPAEYLINSQKEKYKDVGNFTDFAVFELDFEKLELVNVWKNFLGENNGLVTKYNTYNSQELAKVITSNYANNKNNQIKFLSKSYLNDYSKIDVPLKYRQEDAKTWFKKYDELFALGWPNSTEDFFFKAYVDDDQLKYRTRDNFSLWTNSDYRFFNNLTQQEGGQPAFPPERTERGNYLSYAIGFRSFIEKPGIVDAFIAVPQIGNNLYTSSDNKKYINMGLEYLPKHFAPAGGASGTSVRNQKNELVGIYHAKYDSSKTGLAAAFRSEGYDYHGLYGSYNLPQYDLIYGGGKDQTEKKSYREAMKDIYQNNNIKTALFPDGFDKIPDEFKFNNN